MNDPQYYFDQIGRCAEDPIFFIDNYIKVVHPVRGLVPFVLYPFQRRIVACFLKNRFTVLRKFRQAGCTTICAAFALWTIVFNGFQTIPVLSKGDLESTEFLDRVKVMFDELPSWLKPEVKEFNKHTLKLSNQSVIKSRASGKESGRSLSGSLLIVDEAAFIENIDTIWAAAYPTISTGGRAIVLSTVNGIGNWFHGTYMEASRGENSFTPIDIEWKEHPEYCRHEGYEHLYEEMLQRSPPFNIDDWEKVTRSNMDHKKWLQEYECEFLGTGDTFVDGLILRQLLDNVDEDYMIAYNNRMRVWKDPEPVYDYLICADSSYGRQRDYSAFHVINMYTGEQVAEFYSNRTPINEFARIIVNEAYKYNNAYVVPERNSLGLHLIDIMFNELEYDNIWRDRSKKLGTGKNAPGAGEFGFQMTMKSRETMLAALEEAIRTEFIKINSKRLVTELFTFIINEDTGKVEADVNCHDDLIMALGVGVYAFKGLIETTPIDRSLPKEDKEKMMGLSLTKYNMRTNDGSFVEEDISWLLKD
jgi:hypothetical protein